MACTLQPERTLWLSGLVRIAGIDEAGRGCLAGPVVAGAAVLKHDFSLPGLNDSKKLSPARREALFAALTSGAAAEWAVGVADEGEIDHLNILRATHLAMRRAMEALVPTPEHALIDGLPVSDFPIAQTALVGGDGLSLSIAAASILAKVTRDRLMQEFDREFPAYGFAKHKGYATAEHLAMLRLHGPCRIHRRSFEPVAQASLGF